MTRSLALLLPCLALASCAKQPGNSLMQSQSMAPSSNVFLRNSFDTDPSSYIGRFVAEGDTALDESNGMALACSKHISWRKVDGGGVKYTELFTTSSEVSARLGIPLVVNAKGSGSASGIARVEYTLTGKMIGEIEDPEAFNACCTRQPEQCTTRYIGEFLEGTGAVYHQTARAASADVSVNTPKGGGDASGSHQADWQRSVEFPNPVYFAFKTAGTTHTQSTGTECTDWNDDLPVARGGSYVLGVSKRPAKNETAARNRALINATNTAAMQGLITYPGMDDAMDAGMDEETEAEDLDSMDFSPDKAIEARDWCVELVRTEKGDRYIAKVLGFVADDAPAPAAGGFQRR